MGRHALGIYGGTFDPVHTGHLRMAEVALESLPLAELRLVPCGLPPHRETPHAGAVHRLAMLHLALAGHPGLRVDDREIRRGGISYSVDTLDSLRAEYGLSRPLVLLMGADAFQGLTGWKHWQQLPVLCHIAVLARPGYALQVPAGLAVERLHEAAALDDSPAGGLYVIDNPLLPLSATAVRQRIAGEQDTSGFLHPEVRAYIENHRLYAGASPL